MRTIGRKWTGSRGDYQAMCDYCGVQWRRDQLRRDASGKLACPDDQRGRDEVTLSNLNAARTTRRLDRRNDGGAGWDHDVTVQPPVPPPPPPFVPTYTLVTAGGVQVTVGGVSVIL